MKFIIYELVQPSHLKDIDYEGYQPKTIYRSVLQKLDVTGVEEEHPTFESAVSEISNKKEHLKNCQLTILPIISVFYDGSIQ